MDKQIGATIILLDETETLLIIEEPGQKRGPEKKFMGWLNWLKTIFVESTNVDLMGFDLMEVQIC